MANIKISIGGKGGGRRARGGLGLHPAVHGAPQSARITTKAQLIDALTDAAALEHQFMCQYLYAAFSLKKSPDETCDAAQFEAVRRWASTIYMTARQEMEHLSVVNSLLTAVGGAPYFGHAGFPTRSPYYGSAALAEKHGDIPGLPVPCEIPFVLERLSLRSARRFACMESPRLSDVPDADRANVRRWGFHQPGTACSAIVPPWDAAAAPEAVPAEVGVGTVQRLYLDIAFGLRNLEHSIGAEKLFSGRAAGSAQAEVQSEYQIFLFPITNIREAIAAINMVTQQGEGLNAPAGFDSHFMNYYEIAQELAAILERSPEFEPAKDVPLNPTLSSFENPDARYAAGLFNYGYVTLLLMLTGYYGLYRKDQFNKKPTYLTATLEYNSFAPFMTMFVRTLAEILTGIPAGSPSDPARAGPVFNISPECMELLRTPPEPKNEYGKLQFYDARLVKLLDGIAKLSQSATLPPEAKSRLGFMLQNMTRMRANFGYIDKKGIFPPFNPNLPPQQPGTNPPEIDV